MRRHRTTIARGLVEIAFIVFLFYANLLMGEFTATNGTHKTWMMAFHDIYSTRNFEIALVAAAVGFVVFESLRSKTSE